MEGSPGLRLTLDRSGKKFDESVLFRIFEVRAHSAQGVAIKRLLRRRTHE